MGKLQSISSIILLKINCGQNINFPEKSFNYIFKVIEMWLKNPEKN